MLGDAARAGVGQRRLDVDTGDTRLDDLLRLLGGDLHVFLDDDLAGLGVHDGGRREASVDALLEGGKQGVTGAVDQPDAGDRLALFDTGAGLDDDILRDVDHAAGEVTRVGPCARRASR